MRLTAPWRVAVDCADLAQQAAEWHQSALKLAELLTQKTNDLALWQGECGKLMTQADQARREAEHWREQYERVLEDTKAERRELVQHVVDLKREGFAAGQVAAAAQQAPQTMLPEGIERAIGMRDFDTNVTRANRAYALEQLRLRPDAADDIAKEILRGEQFDTYADTDEVAA